MASTIGGLLREMFPDGTEPLEGLNPTWEVLPIWPPDIFAFCSTIVEQSGCYVKVAPAFGEQTSVDFGAFSDSADFRAQAEAIAWGMQLFSGVREEGSYLRQHIQFIARGLPKVAKGQPTALQRSKEIAGVDLHPVRALWQSLIDAAHETLASEGALEEHHGAAIKLMLLTDEACRGIGFSPSNNIEPNWVQGLLLMTLSQREEENSGRKDDDRRWFSSCTSDILKGYSPLGQRLSVFNPNACSVLPKTRTATIGCTLRSMTHNLALLPPAHLVEARWRMSPFRPTNPGCRSDLSGVSKDLNLLIVPFPYQIKLSSFSADRPDPNQGWGYFGVSQDWLPPNETTFGAFVRDMFSSAEESIGEIHGVIFPEFSLDSRCFQSIADSLRKTINSTESKQGFEFLLAGLSDQRETYDSDTKNGSPRKGNFVQMMGIHRNVVDGMPLKERGEAQWTFRGARAKHHRWKINGRQSNRYGLASALDPTISWWEGIPLERRVLEFYELRGGTSMTAMICEDLARADPVQSVLRSVGPNLVIALLMDGPQRSYRWPGHYAGVLADDPGSSVLTVTSLGLIDRASATEATPSRSVAFFKDCEGNQQELILPPGAHAIAVSLKSKRRTENTLDRRSDGGFAYVWQLGEVCPVRVPPSKVPDWASTP